LCRLGEALHEAQEAGVELDRIEQAEYPAKGVMARDAVAQAQELPQKGLLGPAEQRHVGTILAATQRRAQADHQDLEQIVAGVGLSRILEIREAGFELLHGPLRL
jgi:hypothetical protein